MLASRLVLVVRARRRCNGTASTGTAAPVTGAAVTLDALPLHLRRARTVRTSIEANTGICRGMLRVRYDDKGEGEEEL